MEAVKFKVWYGDICKVAELSRTMGMGNGVHIQLYIDGYYQGVFFKRGDEWVFPMELTADEGYILIDIIEKHFMD